MFCLARLTVGRSRWRRRSKAVRSYATPGTLIHTATATSGEIDELWLWAVNTDSATRKLTVELGGTTSPDDLIEVGVPAESGLVLVVPGLVLRNGLVIPCVRCGGERPHDRRIRQPDRTVTAYGRQRQPGKIDPLGRPRYPDSVSGLKLRLKADGVLWQDAARTTPATADSAPVGCWDDASGVGNHFTQATAGNRPLLRTAIVNGHPVIRFDGSNDTLLTTTATGLDSASFTQLAVVSVSGRGLDIWHRVPLRDRGPPRFFASTTLGSIRRARRSL